MHTLYHSKLINRAGCWQKLNAHLSPSTAECIVYIHSSNLSFLVHPLMSSVHKHRLRLNLFTPYTSYKDDFGQSLVIHCMSNIVDSILKSMQDPHLKVFCLSL